MADNIKQCRLCGCTDLNACVSETGDVCHWVSPGICSACAPRAQLIEAVIMDIRDEIERACRKHPAGMTSPHEGYAVILEELDELWDHVKADTGRAPEAFIEAIQVAAMGARYALDIVSEDKADG